MQMSITFPKETVFIALVLFLPSVKCVDSRKVPFNVGNDKLIVLKDVTAGPFKLKSTVESTDPCAVKPAKPVDCGDIVTNCGSGIYDIYPSTTYPITVYCDMTGYNWTVIQRRVDGVVSFYRTWADYKTGFGNLADNFWLGNDYIHTIVNSRSYMIRFDLEDWYGNVGYAEYETFRIGDDSSNYTLTLDDYDGNVQVNILKAYISCFSVPLYIISIIFSSSITLR
ncbi:Angiopoietin-4 [Mytilus edulis]|uniref:Angiopoietin-4 n=1 Tax=Mytilus edulis TaxID=6550 RepID=A0A8S3UAF7_MYTED|nr:Angiopoietin-4 [Mytilus edulis]